MENIYAVICSLILMLPLVVQFYMLITDPKKLFTIFHYYATDDEANKTPPPKLLEHYTKEPSTFQAESDSKMLLTNLRAVSSSPALARPSASRRTDASSPEAKHSFTFVETGETLPVVDIGCTYSSCRYKAFEACLRDHYGARYPPAEVVLNSMQLHLADSGARVAANAAGLFDFIKESEPALNDREVPRKLEIEYLNPLDHFVTRRIRRPSTEDRSTETCGERGRETLSDAASCPDSIKDVINASGKNTRIDRRLAKTSGLQARPGMKLVKRGKERKLDSNRVTFKKIGSEDID
nr:uncharacterized protein LOC116435027 [Nomia melanderi]